MTHLFVNELSVRCQAITGTNADVSLLHNLIYANKFSMSEHENSATMDGDNKISMMVLTVMMILLLAIITITMMKMMTLMITMMLMTTTTMVMRRMVIWFPTQRPVTRSFDVYFDLRLNTRLSKQPWGWWFETLSWSLWRHCNGNTPFAWVMLITTWWMGAGGN